MKKLRRVIECLFRADVRRVAPLSPARLPAMETLEPRLLLSASPVTALRITELNYNPATANAGSSFTRGDYEFIELKNIAAEPVNLNGVQFTQGIAFTFPDITLSPGQFVLVVKNQAAFTERYGVVGATIAGQFATTSLDDSGERIALATAGGQTIQDFTFDDNWHPLTDGDGYTLVVRDATQLLSAYSTRDGWRTSAQLLGSPGVDDVGLYPGAIVISELLAHSDLAMGDWVEIQNTSNTPQNLGGWMLSDRNDTRNKFVIPANTIVPAGGMLVLTEADHFGRASHPGSNTVFAFSELGEDIYLTPPGDIGDIYGDSFTFGATERNVSLARYVLSDGRVERLPAAALTMGAPNAAPRIGPVIINELHYHPIDDSGVEEFVELFNISNQTVNFFHPAETQNTWQFASGITFTFPMGVSLAAKQRMLLVPVDPAAYRAANAIPASVQIFQYTGSLNNAGERVELTRPGDPEGAGSSMPGFVPYYHVDGTRYRDLDPWPTSPDGGGPSLARYRVDSIGFDPQAWAPGPVNGTPGAANTYTEVPPGDINNDRRADAADIDQLYRDFGKFMPTSDLNNDGVITQADVNRLVLDRLGSVFGDINLDKKNDITDLSIIATFFGSTNAGWAIGDLNGDRVVNIADLSLLASFFGAVGTGFGAGIAAGDGAGADPSADVLVEAAEARQVVTAPATTGGDDDEAPAWRHIDDILRSVE